MTTTKFKVGDLVRRVKNTLEILKVITWEEYSKTFKFPLCALYIGIEMLPVKSVTNGDVSWKWLKDLELLEVVKSKTTKQIKQKIKLGQRKVKLGQRKLQEE